MQHNCSFIVGSGTHILFWQDVWLENSKLKDHFAHLYRAIKFPFCSIVDCWDKDTLSWNIEARRSLKEVETEQLLALLSSLSLISLSNQRDQIRCDLEKSGLFSVKSLALAHTKVSPSREIE